MGVKFIGCLVVCTSKVLNFNYFGFLLYLIV